MPDPTNPPPADPRLQALARVLRSELPHLLRAGGNWKIILHGSAGGAINVVIERHVLLPSPKRPA